MMVWQRPNLLLLDEPTNHLDLATREALSVALNEFEGTVLLVSHDRALLRAVCDEFWLVGRGEIQPFDGDLDDYQQYLLDESRRLREQARSASQAQVRTAAADTPAPPPARSAVPSAAHLRPLQSELKEVELRLAALQQDQATLETQMAAPPPPAQMAQVGRRLKALGEEIETLEERWLELSTQIERLGAPV